MTRSRQLRAPLGALVAVAAMVALSTGCQVWPFKDNDRSSIITPDMRVASIKEAGARANDKSTADQAAMCEELAQQIRTEPDPIVRKSIQEAVAQMKTPLATQVLLAGLNDEDRDVRIACCRQLAKRQDAEGIKPLSRIVAVESDPEVRMAATAALGKYKSPEAIIGLTPAVKDRDPAMQYAGVEAMKSASGQKLGNDVEAWRQYAQSLSPGDDGGAGPNGREINVAAQPGASGTVR